MSGCLSWRTGRTGFPWDIKGKCEEKKMMLSKGDSLCGRSRIEYYGKLGWTDKKGENYRKAKEKKELCVRIMGYGMKRGGIPQGGEKI